MGITKASDYALLVTAYLGSQNGDMLKSKSEISRRLNLPREFLSQILQKLTRAGILKSIRGVKGGYSLAKPSEKISFLDVIESIDGKSHMLYCLTEDFEHCGRTGLCSPIMEKMDYVDKAIDEILDGITFEDINISSQNLFHKSVTGSCHHTEKSCHHLEKKETHRHE